MKSKEIWSEPGQWCRLDHGIPQPGVKVHVLMGDGRILEDRLVKSKYGYTFEKYSSVTSTGIKSWSPIDKPLSLGKAAFEYT